MLLSVALASIAAFSSRWKTRPANPAAGIQMAMSAVLFGM
jgi:hypothetical protein